MISARAIPASEYSALRTRIFEASAAPFNAITFIVMPSITNPRDRTSGLAERTLKNLIFLENAQQSGADVHLVTHVINSLLALLVFPVEKEELFFAQWTAFSLPSAANPTPSEVGQIKTTINKVVTIPSLNVVMFDRCCDVPTFFRKIRNAISHKNIEFDSDSLVLSDVTVTLKDKLKPASPVHWEITIKANDLRTVGFFLGTEIVKKGL